MRPILALLFLVPAAVAGGAYENASSVSPGAAGLLLEWETYAFEAEAGDEIVATLDYDALRGRLTMGIIGPAPPVPAICVPLVCVGYAMLDELCGNKAYGGDATDPAPVTARLVADVAGTYTVEVYGEFVPEELPYRIAISQDGEAPRHVTFTTDREIYAYPGYPTLCKLA